MEMTVALGEAVAHSELGSRLEELAMRRSAGDAAAVLTASVAPQSAGSSLLLRTRFRTAPAAGLLPGHPHCVLWLRDELAFGAGAVPQPTGRSTVEPFVAVVWDGPAYVARLIAGGTNGMEADVRCLRRAVAEHVARNTGAAASLPERAVRVVFVLQAVRAALSALQKAKQQRGRGGPVDGDAVAVAVAASRGMVVTPEGLDAAHMHLYVTCDLEVNETASVGETSELLVSMTRTIAERRYKQAPEALAVLTRIRVGRMAAAQLQQHNQARGLDATAAPGGGEVESSDAETHSLADAPAAATAAFAAAAGQAANDEPHAARRFLAETWWAQLQMVPGVSSKKALAIVSAYPSPQALVLRYRDPRLTTAEKEHLLEDIIEPGRKNFKISSCIYRAFTTVNPEEKIG
jgi:hypothetical protein